jgi:hypothetical protein
LRAGRALKASPSAYLLTGSPAALAVVIGKFTVDPNYIVTVRPVLTSLVVPKVRTSMTVPSAVTSLEVEDE